MPATLRHRPRCREDGLHAARTIYDPSLRRPVATDVKVDESRLARTRLFYDESLGLVTGTERPESVARGLGEVSSVAYDAYKLFPATTVNAVGHITTASYDLGTGAPLRTTGPQFRCPTIGVPCIDPYRKYRQTDFRYDGLGRLLSQRESFDQGPMDYQQLEATRVTYEDWNGTFPARSRVISEQRLAPAATSLWTRQEHSVDGLGRPVRDVVRTFAGADEVRTYQYDHRGLTTAVSAPDPSQAAAAMVTHQYNYDGLGRLAAVTHSSGLGGTRRVTRDGLWMETRLEPADGGPAPRVRVLSDVFGRVVRVEERAGTPSADGQPAVTEYGYDANGYLEQILDADGLVTRIGNDRSGNRVWIERGGQRWDYSYDLEGRVKTATVPHLAGQAAAHTSVTEYDALGRVARHVPAPGTLTEAEQTELRFGALLQV